MPFEFHIYNDSNQKLSINKYEYDSFVLGDVLLSTDNFELYEIDTSYADYLRNLKIDINKQDFYIHFANCLSNLVELMNYSGTDVLLQDRQISKVAYFEKLLSTEDASRHPEAFKSFVAKARSSLDSAIQGIEESGLSKSLCHFSSFLRVHKDFSRVMSGKNQALFEKINLITRKKKASRFDCYCLIDLISQLNIPGISQAKIYSTLSKTRQRLEKIDFPLNLIPKRYLILFNDSIEPNEKQQVIDLYHVEIQLWLKKAEYVHSVFQKSNDVPNYGVINDLLDEETVSLNEFRQDLSYRMKRTTEGLFTAKPAKDRLFTNKLPPLHRCLLMIEKRKNTGLKIHPKDLELLYTVCTPLYLAAWLGDDLALDNEIKKGVDLNEKRKTDKTALMVAILRNHIKIVKTLIANGADNPYKHLTNTQIRQELGKINPQMFFVLRDEHAVKVDEFHEVVRRIPKAVLTKIESALTEVTLEQLALLQCALKDPINLLNSTSFIHDDMFPTVALKALALNEITVLELGTLMSLWGNLSNIIPKPGEIFNLPEFIPLLQSNGKPNPQALELLSQSISLGKIRELGFVSMPEEEIIDGIMKCANSLTAHEQGFWLVTNTNELHLEELPETVSQRIKNIGFKFLHYTDDIYQEMIPSFGLKQLFLDVISSCSVKLNPVIGDSSTDDIRLSGILRSRDIALPFPGVPLPMIADSYPAPKVCDFIFHDFYHAMRAGDIPKEETSYYIVMGDHLKSMQSTFNQAVKQFESQHKKNKNMVPAFINNIKALSPNVQNKALIMLSEKLKKEYVIIETLKKLRKYTGQLKFIMYDMEHYGKSFLDFYCSHYDPIVNMLKTLQIHMLALHHRPGAHKYGPQTTSVICHSVIHAMMLDNRELNRAASVLRESPSRLVIIGSRAGDFMNKAIEKEIGPSFQI